jgi:hypothetical protein
MTWMFYGAYAFDQDLGWCVDNGAEFASFSARASGCASTLCGVKWGDCEFPPTGSVMVNWKIRWAVAAWISDATAAEAIYGHISTWDTSGVTDMAYLFEHRSPFNEDIGGWDVSGVTTMYQMFHGAYDFDQDIGDWAVDSVTDMSWMFTHASLFNQDIGAWDTSGVTSMYHMFYEAPSFNQDLGWCLDDEVVMDVAFYDTQCEATSCGVIQGTCPPTPAPTPAPTPPPTVGPVTSSSSGGGGAIAVIAGAAAAAAFLLAVGAFWFYRRRKASMMDKADEPIGANPEPTELPPPVEEATPPNEEEATISVAPDAEEASTEQPPPPPARRTKPKPAAKAEEMYNQIAAWYNEPENAALRATWGAYPDPGEFQTWRGFVAVTNAFLDREAG